MSEHPRFGEFILGFEGLAILRNWMTDPKTVKARAREIIELVGRMDEYPWSNPVVGVERSVSEGYGESAATYDEGKNPLMLAEGDVVRGLIRKHAPGRALDAACGTGRHAAYMASLGHPVIGIDATAEMASIAKSKVSDAEFEVADIASMPIESCSIDLAVCSLALTHCADLEPPLRELGRVLKPGGKLIISDMHPFVVMLGSHSEYPRGDVERGFIRNYVHLYSDYMRAFQAAGLGVVQFLEPTYGDREIAAMGLSGLLPRLMESAARGVPIAIVWELTTDS